MPAGDYFLAVYVMLSRATKLDDIWIVGLPDRDVFESKNGPGLAALGKLAARLAYFDRMAQAGERDSERLMQNLGWSSGLDFSRDRSASSCE